MNGAAARLVRVNDRIIIMSFMYIDEDKQIKPKIVRLDGNNKPI